MNFLTFVALIVTVAVSSGFNLNGKRKVPSFKLKLADDSSSDPAPIPEGTTFEKEDPRMFDMNRRVRLGRSKDQDGKSNIWSIEPAMEVMEENEGGSLKNNLFVAGTVIGAALVSLPLFSAFSTLFPDPSDF